MDHLVRGVGLLSGRFINFWYAIARGLVHIKDQLIPKGLLFPLVPSKNIQTETTEISRRNFETFEILYFLRSIAQFFYTNLHELFCQFISWTNWVNSGKSMDNCWISCQVMADMENFYDDLMIINLHFDTLFLLRKVHLF